MTLYLDTSALVKVYISEEYSELVRKIYKEADIIAISSIGYVEFNSAIAQLLRESYLNDFQFKGIISDFNSSWNSYQIIQPNNAVLIRAASLVYKSELRAFDSIHLSSAEYLAFNTNDNVIFGCFDKRLINAAKSLDLMLII